MAAKALAKIKRKDAEWAAEWAAVLEFGCVETRRALRTKFARVDFYGADILGCLRDGSKMYVQVTAGQGDKVLERRKKMEKYPWHSSERVFVWQLVERQDIENPRKKEWHFRVWEYIRQRQPGDPVWVRKWAACSPIRVDKAWFKAYRPEKTEKDDE